MRALPCMLLPLVLVLSCTPDGGGPADTEPTTAGSGGSSGSAGLDHRGAATTPTGDGHGSTRAGGASPQDGGAWVFQPVWDAMYTSE
jgi:hypothetical protein